MQSITMFANLGESISACSSSAYGRCAHCCGLGRCFCIDSHTVPVAPAYVPTYGGFISLRTFFSMLAPTASWRILLRRSQSAVDFSPAAAGLMFRQAWLKSLRPRAANALFAKYGSHQVSGFGARHESDSLQP